MSNIIRLKIDVTKIDKSRLFRGKKGVYLDAVLIPLRQPSDFGDTHIITQDVSKEERDQGIKGAILGNGREIVTTVREVAAKASKEAQADTWNEDEETDDIPF